MAILKIFKTQIVPNRNFLIQNIDQYIDSLTPTYQDATFQFIRPLIDTSIKIEVAEDTWGTQDIDNTSLVPLLGNYLRIEETINGTSKKFYYFIMGASYIAPGTVSLQLSMDTINTFSDYLYNTENYSDMTSITRATVRRWTSDRKPLIDKYPERLSLSPSSYYKSYDREIQENISDAIDVDWYAVYKTNDPVIGSGQSGASANPITTLLVPSEDFTITDYTYYGDYEEFVAHYTGGYEPVLAPNAGEAYGHQFIYIPINSNGIICPVRFEIYHQSGGTWNFFDITRGNFYDEYERVWGLYDVFMTGNSPEGATTHSVYITFIYYCAASNTYIALRNSADSSRGWYVYSSATGNFVQGSNWAGNRWDFAASGSASEANTTFASPDQIQLNTSGGDIRDTYNGEIRIKVTSTNNSVSAIKGYSSSTQKYTVNYYTNNPTGSTEHHVHQFIAGLGSLDRTDSKLIKIIRCPYCPVSYEKVSLYGGFTYDFEGFVISGNTLTKAGNPLSYPVKLEPTNKSLIYNGYINVNNVISSNNYLFNSEPKLKYGQDTFVRKYVFDNQTLNMPYEIYDLNNQGLGHIKDDVEYMHTRELSSDLLFKVTPDDSISDTTSYSVYDYGNILLSSRNLEEPILNNDYLNYMRYGYNYEKRTLEQNIQAQKLSTGISTATSIVGGTVGGALAGFKFGGVPGAIGGAIIGLASSALSATSRITSMNASIEAAKNSFNEKLTTLSNQATSVGNSNAVDLLKEYSNVKLHYMEYQVVPELMKPIANLYHYCGYSHPVQGKPEWTRYWFDFVQCTPVFKNNIFQNIYANYQQDISYRFENGVTILHNRNGSYDFNQTKQNWETGLSARYDINDLTNINFTVTPGTHYETTAMRATWVGDSIEAPNQYIKYDIFWTEADWQENEPNETYELIPNGIGMITETVRHQGLWCVRFIVMDTINTWKTSDPLVIYEGIDSDA